MRTTRPHAVRLLAAAAVLSVPFALSACDAAAEKAAEEAIEQAAESDGQDVEVDLDEDGGVKVEGSDGSYEVGVDTEIPEDFPSDEIPLVDGTVVSAVSGTETGTEDGWIIGMEVDGSAEEVFEVAGASLEQAGFAMDGEQFGTTGAWSSDAWTVTILTGESSGTTSIQYYVGPAA